MTGGELRIFALLKCEKLSAACGFNCAIDPTFCYHCDAIVSKNAPGDGVDCLNSKMLSRLYKTDLAARIIAGDCPRFQEPNPVNMPEAFAKYVCISKLDEQANLIKQAYIYQCAIPEAEGGLSAEDLGVEFEALAAQFGLTDALDQVVSAQEEAANADAS